MIFQLLMLALWLATTGCIFYGVYLAFKKHIALGVVSILVPGFPLVLGAAKLLFKKDLLA